MQNMHNRKFVQISMDGPQVNCKFYDSIIEDRNENMITKAWLVLCHVVFMW